MGRDTTGWLLAALLAGPGCYAGVDDGEAEGGDGAEDGDGDGDGDGADGEGDGDDDDDDDDAGAQCDGTQPPRAALRRMSKATYVHALTDVFGADAVAGVQLSIDAMPATHGGTYSTETLAPTYGRGHRGLRRGQQARVQPHRRRHRARRDRPVPDQRPRRCRPEHGRLPRRRPRRLRPSLAPPTAHRCRPRPPHRGLRDRRAITACRRAWRRCSPRCSSTPSSSTTVASSQARRSSRAWSR